MPIRETLKRIEARRSGVSIEEKPTWCSLDELRKANWHYRVRSSVLGDDVYLCSNGKVKVHLQCEGLVVYTLDEVLAMKGLPEEMIRQIHAVKKEMGGEVIEEGNGQG